MTNPKLLEVGARLEKTVKELTDKELGSDDLYGTYEMVAIQILDSEFEDFPEGELEQYLTEFLSKQRR